MLKKISCFLVICAVSVSIFCACAQKPNQNASSGITSSEAAYSEVETSSAASSEKESSKKESSSKKEENGQSSSEKQEESSSKNSSSKNNSSKKDNSNKSSSSKKEYENKVEPISSENAETSSKKTDTNTTTTSSRSESIKKNVKPAEALQIGAFHFNPKWTTNYGKDDASRMAEMDDVLSTGYFNTLQVELPYAANKEFWEVCVKNDTSVWILLYAYFDSSEGTTIEEYIAEVDKAVSVIKSNPEWWDNFCGFAFEESVWRGQTNADFLAESEALYKKYGKRNHVVLATGEFTGVEGNELQLGVTADEMKKILPNSLKYCTDVAFDSYSVDVRDGSYNGSIIASTANELPNVTDGQSYYRELTKLLVRLAGHDVNVWFYPCVYTPKLWGGGRADEDYCLAHLNFFDKLLKEQEYQGGLMLYTYTQFSDANEIGLQSHLIVKNDAGEQLRPLEVKWMRYSMRLAQITTEYKQTKAKLAK